VQDLLELIHGEFHLGIDRMTRRLDEFFIHGLAKQLQLHNTHCPICRLNQTSRQRPLGELMPIRSPAEPFHTIAMNFLVGLPAVQAVSPWKIEGKDGFESLLTSSDKFSKRCLLIPGRKTYGAREWGLPKSIISDHDPKFTSEFWKEIFKQLNVQRMMTTAYHPQADGLSERRNQTVEIAIRFSCLWQSWRPMDQRNRITTGVSEQHIRRRD
jgi:hypothetical protein